jgi:hypothetical protein
MPKATRLDHIAIAVRDIDAGIEKWTTLRAGVRIPTASRSARCAARSC